MSEENFNLNVVLGVGFIIVGLLSIAISLPLLRGKIKPNYWYGFRIPKAYKSEENWFKINRYGAQKLIQWSAGLIALGIIAFFLPLSKDAPFTILFSFSPVIFVLVPTIQVFRYAGKL